MVGIMEAILYYIAHRCWNVGYRPINTLVLKPIAVRDFTERVLGTSVGVDEVVKALTELGVNTVDPKTGTVVRNEHVIKLLKSLDFKIPCPWCSEKFSEVKDLVKHVASAHSTQIVVEGNSCKVCSRKFRGINEVCQHYLKKHLNVNSIAEAIKAIAPSIT
ncbi:MAG: hypothetical protein DRJ40_07665 [Thermoprotei archaeon]|nr:MAG: hypothetical protein DRJ40_07665 [Thermoprotei archaeon]